MGGSAVSIPGGELYMAMKLGTIDGAIYDASGLMDVKFHEVVKYYTFPTLAQIACSFLINKDSLKRLPPDLQAMVEHGTRYILQDTSMQYITETKDSFIKAKSIGSVEESWMESGEVAKARKLVKPLWDELGRKSPRMKRGIDIMYERMRYYGRPIG